MQTINKPFAPFGAVIHQLRLELKNIKTSLFLYVGRYAEIEARKSWEGGNASLCLPIGWQACNYAWPIEGLKIIVVDTGSMTGLGLKKIAYELLKAGSELVVIHTDTKPMVDIFQLKKDLMNGTKQC